MPENEVSSLADAIKGLETSVMVSGDPLILEVRRSHVVKDAMKEARKSKFKPTKFTKVSSKVSYCVISNVILLPHMHLKVRFIGEGAVDYGGPRREFFRLLALKAGDEFFEGPPTKKFFALNVPAIQVSVT